MNKLIPLAILVSMSALLFLSWRNVVGYNSKITAEYARHQELADDYVEKEIYIDAVKEYEAMLLMTPDNYGIAMKIVEMYKLLDEPKAYVNALENAIKVDNTNSTAYLEMARYYLFAKKYEKACKILYRAQKAIEGNTEITELMIRVKSRYTTTPLKYETVGRVYYEDGKEKGTTVMSKNGLYGLMNSSNKVLIECEYEYVGPLAEKLIPVKRNGKYYYLNEDGQRKFVPEAEDETEFLGVFGNGYAPACMNGMYGYVDDDKLEKHHFEYNYAGSFANGIAAVEKDGKWAVINKSFKNVTEFEFDEILMDEYNFCSLYEVFFAKKDGLYYLYNKKGEKISDGFEDARIFASAEPAAVKKDGKWGFISTKGEMIIEPTYEDANSFSLGYAPYLEDDLWGCIDNEGNVLIEPTFESIRPFSRNGYALVEIDGDEKFVLVNLYE